MCYEYERNPDYIDCTKYYENLYSQCIVGCPAGDFECLSMCFRNLEENLEFCPCRSRCPDGCPCPEYECPPTTTVKSTTTTTVTDTTQSTEAKPKNSILVLSTYGGVWRPPVITDAKARVENNFYFRFGETTSVYYGCSLTFRDELYIFGGYSGNDARQISKLVGCHIQPIGTLEFDYEHGACTNFNDEKVYLCFSESFGESDRCRFASNPDSQFIEAAKTVYVHTYASIASSKCEYSQVLV